MIKLIKKEHKNEKQISLAANQLFVELQQLIIKTKKQVSSQVNSALTQLYWYIGKQINNELLKDQRAQYGQAIVKMLSKKLTLEFGKGFQEKSLRRMIQFHQVFTEFEIVATVSRQLSWSHFILLLPIKDPLAQEFYLHIKAQLQHKLHQVMASRLDITKDQSRIHHES